MSYGYGAGWGNSHESSSGRNDGYGTQGPGTNDGYGRQGPGTNDGYGRQGPGTNDGYGMGERVYEGWGRSDFSYAPFSHSPGCASRRPIPLSTAPGRAIKWMLGIAGLAIVGIVLAHVNIQDTPTSRHEAHTFQTVMIVALVSSVILAVLFGIWNSKLQAPGPGPCDCGT